MSPRRAATKKKAATKTSTGRKKRAATTRAGTKRTATKRTAPTGAAAGAPILLVDAGLAAGWRRAAPDLDQLDEVVAAARERFADTVVLAEASLKWSLPDAQQERFEEYRATSKVLCAPGGTKGGHHAFLASAATAAAGAGREVWVLSALSLGEGPWKLALLRRPDGKWQIEAS